MKRVVLDEQQDRHLRDMAAERADAYEERELRSLRRLAIWCLTLWRWWDPVAYDEWDRNRIELHKASTAWYRR